MAASGNGQAQHDDLAPAFVDVDNLEGAEVLADLNEDDVEPAGEDDEEDLEEDGNEDEKDEGEDLDMEDVPDDALNVLRAHSDAVVSVAWHPSDPTVAASGGCDDKAFLFRIAGEGPEAAVEQVELSGHTDTVSSLGFSSDGSLLATAGLDGKVLIWDAQGSGKQSLEGPAEGVEFLSWHPRGPVVLAGSEDFSAWMWNATTGACMQVFTGHSGSVTCGMFTPDGKNIVTGSADATVRIWDPKTGACSFLVQGHPFHEGPVTCLDASGSSGLVLSGSEDFTARLCTLVGGKVKGTLQGHTDSVECVKLGPAGQASSWAATGSMDGNLMVWDLQSLQARTTCPNGKQDGVVQLAWHPTDPVVFTASLDGILRAFDCRTGQCVRTLGGHTAGIQSISVRNDGKYVLTGSDDNTVRMFSTA
mmetsp:Transcript_35280/g.48973  ORF Transcript_35280/g.48973 Transcript_35280/m.48973 type:complete len:418 (+) Transcript_35280:412-1665(+)|eukprot:CAMPEP_0196599202 /NCGR_PEP_ID=MMETSP1081-20130531/94734_1 /TAXON_ID=36882 /ORGANISM="Pyramimonas amylifera, Strain CCMP720" /LENGTH=417 /DNA_ID=CAMNT_0041924961 /DNA_START=391 /DNA_END=1644 /DNA_ORIENTATION=+